MLPVIQCGRDMIEIIKVNIWSAEQSVMNVGRWTTGWWISPFQEWVTWIYLILLVMTSNTIEDYSQLYVHKLLRLHGIHLSIIMDRGTQCTFYFWQLFQKDLGRKAKLDNYFLFLAIYFYLWLSLFIKIVIILVSRYVHLKYYMGVGVNHLLISLKLVK